MSLENITAVSVTVREVQVALDFYVNVLGMEKRLNQEMEPGFFLTVVAPRKSATGIMLQAARTEEDRARIGSWTGIVLECDDLDKTYQELSGRGVYFIEEPSRQGWGGMQAIFADLDGNIFVLHSN